MQAPERKELEEYRAEVVAEESELEALETVLEQGDAEPSDYSRLASLYARRQEWARAAELEANGDGTVPGRLGYYLLKAGAFAEADRFYRGIPPERRTPDLLLNHGIALAALGNDQEAEALYREALDRKEDFPQAWLYLGNALVRQGRNQEAVQAFRRYLQAGKESRAAEQVRRILEQLTGETPS